MHDYKHSRIERTLDRHSWRIAAAYVALCAIVLVILAAPDWWPWLDAVCQ